MFLIFFILNFHAGLGVSNSFSEFSNLTYGFVPYLTLGIEGEEEIPYIVEGEFFGDRGVYSYSYLGSERKLKMSFYGFLFKIGTSFSSKVDLLKNLGMGLMLGITKEKRPSEYTDTGDKKILEGSGSAPGLFFYFKTDKKKIFERVYANFRAELYFISFRTIESYYDYCYVPGLSLSGVKMNLIFYYE